MKKYIAMLTMLMMVVFSVLVFAVPTTVDLGWDAFGGTVDITVFNGDDSVGTLVTTGAHFWGEFNSTDFDNNPYSYGVDSGVFTTKSNVEGGGSVSFRVERTDTKSSYGGSGQVSYDEVWSIDGTAFLARRTSTNYASQMNNNYGWATNNYQAAGSQYGVLHSIATGDGDGASINVFGNGSAVINAPNDQLGGNAFRLGIGNGCTNLGPATVAATGAGTYEIMAVGVHELNGNGWTAPNGAAYYANFIFNGGFNSNDTDIDGN